MRLNLGTDLIELAYETARDLLADLYYQYR